MINGTYSEILRQYHEIQRWLESPECTEALFAEKGVPVVRVTLEDAQDLDRCHRLFWFCRWEGAWWAVQKDGVLSCLCETPEHHLDHVTRVLASALHVIAVNEEDRVQVHFNTCDARQRDALRRATDQGRVELSGPGRYTKNLPEMFRLYKHMGWQPRT